MLKMNRRDFVMGLAALAAVPPAMARQSILALPAVGPFIAKMNHEYGFVPEELRTFFAHMEVNRRVIELMDAPTAPNKKVYWQEYRARRLLPRHVVAGVKFHHRHLAALRRAEDNYGVPAEIITAIIGVETKYGRHLGNFAVGRALATLAFLYPRRGREFEDELADFLLYARDAKIDPAALRGSYAGAFGIPQFLPSSVRRFAVDFDNDGRVDLFTATDSIGSIGNFLSMHGWRRGAALLHGVAAPNQVAPFVAATENNDYKPLFSWSELKDAGFTAKDGKPDEGPYLLVDLENRYDTEYRIGGQNFYALMRYNKSFKYAAVVVDLSEAVRQNL